MRLAESVSLMAMLLFPAVVEAQFSYITNNGTITITGYTGPGGMVIIPDTINDLPVTAIGDWSFSSPSDLISITIPNSVISIGYGAFFHCATLTNVTMGNGVTGIADWAFSDCTDLADITLPSKVVGIGDSAFYDCTSLTGVWFRGNSPALGGPSVFYGDDIATVYYLAGTSGWQATLGGRPTVLWNPVIHVNDPAFGVHTNQFRFNITGPTNLLIVVEACTNIAFPIWLSLQTNTLTSGSFYFSDPAWTNYPARFYRIRSP
jgi:hypothetical protein